MLSDSQLISKANQLQREAKRILDELGLIKILKNISSPKLIGSASYGLMIAEDIDIHASVKNYNLNKILNLLPKLAVLPKIRKVQFINYREFRKDYRRDRVGFPHGYYIGLYSMQPAGEWKIDVWFVKEDEVIKYDYSRLNNLSSQERMIILRLKEHWSTKGGYKDGAISIDFYQAVLDFGAKTDEDFRRYLETKDQK